MSKTALIKKINNLTIAESFLQVNFVSGYKYIDRAGEIVNYFHKNKKPPQFEMNLNGLLIYAPEDNLELLKVSSNVLWAHFLSPDSLEQIDSFFTKKAKDITKILEVDEVSRIGWRVYFIYEFANKEDRDKATAKFSHDDNLKFEELTLKSNCNDVALNIRIKKVTKNDSSSTPGLLLDVDFFKNYKDLLSSDKIASEFIKIKEIIRSDNFLQIVNSVISE